MEPVSSPVASTLTLEIEMKLCIFCEHLNKEHQSMGSEWTGAYGEDGFSCAKHHFDEYGEGNTQDIEDMRKLFIRADACVDYFQPLDKE
jgi:hypothetical protein